jgi:O-antigen/teichoic acid export membrane protein
VKDNNTNGEIQKKTVSGIKWTYLSTFLARGFYPLVLIILARILSPSDFGLAAMAMAVSSFFSCFGDLGLKHALVQQKGDEEKIATLVFWILLTFGFFWFFLIWIIAPFMAVYYKSPEVTQLLRVLGLIFIIQPFSDVPLSILLRNLKFKALFYRQLFPQIFSGITSIILALMGYGAWALVIGTLAGIAGTSVMVWHLTVWRPKLYMDFGILRNMFRFGFFLSIQQILGWMTVRVDNLFVGRYLSSLGLYRMGFNYGFLPFQLIGLPFLNVVYPVLCKLNRNKDELRKEYFLYIEWICIASIPLSVAFIFIAPFLIPPLLGNKWLPSIPILQLIAVTSMLSSIVGVNAETYKAIGKPDVTVKYAFFRVLISIPFYYFAAQKSILTLAITHVGLACCFVPINFFICSRVLGFKYLYILKKAKTGLLLGLMILITGLSYNSLIVNIFINNPLGNAFCMALFFLVFGGLMLYIIDRKTFTTIKEFIKNTFTFMGKEVAI